MGRDFVGSENDGIDTTYVLVVKILNHTLRISVCGDCMTSKRVKYLTKCPSRRTVHANGPSNMAKKLLSKTSEVRLLLIRGLCFFKNCDTLIVPKTN